MIMPKKFFGHVLEKNSDRSLTDQIYGVLIKEIISGRWPAGCRMPSFDSLADMANVSRYPLKTALDRLEDEGYISKVRHRGIFVKSTESRGTVLETIGIVAEPGRFSPYHIGIPKFSEGFGLINTDALQEYAGKLGYSMRLIEKPEDLQCGKDIKSIISFLPKSKLLPFNQRQLPTVFLGVEDPLSNPCVTGDCYTAMYELTGNLIERGHRNIVVFAPDFWRDELVDDVLRGHVRAMKEAGLPFNADSVKKSRKLPFNDLKSAREFLEAFPDATAVLTMTIDSALKIEEYADLVGMRIPEDLSLASLQVGTLPEHGSILGSFYQWDAIIKTCFEFILDRRLELNRTAFSRVIMTPELNTNEASSVSSPRKSLRLTVDGKRQYK